MLSLWISEVNIAVLSNGFTLCANNMIPISCDYILHQDRGELLYTLWHKLVGAASY